MENHLEKKSNCQLPTFIRKNLKFAFDNEIKTLDLSIADSSDSFNNKVMQNSGTQNSFISYNINSNSKNSFGKSYIKKDKATEFNSRNKYQMVSNEIKKKCIEEVAFLNLVFSY